ncbi:hypothetical protein ILUMI_09269 [Ignelater luminosus]|uniref:Kazal-like domain-containing protein n=1 Tax=Ignelater luminosus TaxID=2038154 RepID=A0A8K0D470_IGNLU|nr:hypothetical protein ILUMI_09269 [Ignelater luminosus]
MRRSAVCVFALLIVCQSLSVFSRQVDFNDNNFEDQFNQQPSQLPTGTTTTTPSPRYTNCVNACPSTPQYAPVCGTDSVSYYNVQRLKCAQGCGLNVQQAHLGTCRPSAGGK